MSEDGHVRRIMAEPRMCHPVWIDMSQDRAQAQGLTEIEMRDDRGTTTGPGGRHHRGVTVDVRGAERDTIDTGADHGHRTAGMAGTGVPAHEETLMMIYLYRRGRHKMCPTSRLLSWTILTGTFLRKPSV